MTEKPAARISTAGAGAILLALLLAAYVGSFVYLSRTGMRSAEEQGRAYTLLDVESPHYSSSWETSLEQFYFPLIEIDARAISGQRPSLPSAYYMTDDIQYYPQVP